MIAIMKVLRISLVFCGYSMLHAAKEIELKISVPAEKYAQVEAWLKAHAQYQGYSEQKECYITKPGEGWDYSAGFKDTLKTMRIRQEHKGDSFCYKYRHLDPVTKKTTHRDEYETNIEDGSIMVEIMEKLGYTEKTMVLKKRTTYLVSRMFEVTFDDVHTVGKFIEIELKEPTDDVALGLAKIEAIIKEMGITEFKQYDRGYIHMIWNPTYDFGVQRFMS